MGYLGSDRHRRAVAAEIPVKPEELDALKQFEYVEYHKATKELSRGRVKLPRAAA